MAHKKTSWAAGPAGGKFSRLYSTANRGGRMTSRARGLPGHVGYFCPHSRESGDPPPRAVAERVGPRLRGDDMKMDARDHPCSLRRGGAEVPFQHPSKPRAHGTPDARCARSLMRDENKRTS